MYAIWGQNILSLHPLLRFDEKCTKSRHSFSITATHLVISSKVFWLLLAGELLLYTKHQDFKYRKQLNDLCFKYNTVKISYQIIICAKQHTVCNNTKNTDNNLPDQSIPTIISQSVFKNFSYSLFCAFMWRLETDWWDKSWCSTGQFP